MPKLLVSMLLLVALLHLHNHGTNHRRNTCVCCSKDSQRLPKQRQRHVHHFQEEEGLQRWVTLDNPPFLAELVFDVQCTLDNHFSPNAEASRISVAMLGTMACSLGGQEADQLKPSLIGRMFANWHQHCPLSSLVSAQAVSVSKHTPGWAPCSTKGEDGKW